MHEETRIRQDKIKVTYDNLEIHETRRQVRNKLLAKRTFLDGKNFIYAAYAEYKKLLKSIKIIDRLVLRQGGNFRKANIFLVSEPSRTLNIDLFLFPK